MDELTIEAIPPVKTWVLTPAITLGNKEYDSLILRAPSLNEVELSQAESTPIKQIKRLVQLISGVPAAVIEKCPWYIVREAGEYAQSFTSEAVAAYYARAS